MISSGMVTAHPDHAVLCREAAAGRENMRNRIVELLAPFGPAEEIPRLARHLAATMQGISIQARDGIPASELLHIVEDVVAGVRARAAGDRSGRRTA